MTCYSFILNYSITIQLVIVIYLLNVALVKSSKKCITPKFNDYEYCIFI